MVLLSSVATSNGLTHDSDKRRKQTVERAKANHLSRQLQMRLQYAKLKVDHGWQKQNLNEVENLYFHHSHQRGPKPYSNLSVTLMMRDPSTSYSNVTVTTTTPPQSSPSAKSKHSFLPRSHANLSYSSDYAGPSSGLPSPTPNTLLQPAQIGTSSSRNSDFTSDATEVVDESDRLTPTTAHHVSSPTTGSAKAVDYATTNPNVTSAASSSLPSWTPHPLPTLFNHYPHAIIRQSTAHKPTSSSTAVGESSFSFPSVSLTYDSFWSSHSSTGSRSFRSPSGHDAGYTPDTDVINVGGGSERT